MICGREDPYAQNEPREPTACFQVPGSEVADEPLGKEETLALICKQNHDYSENIVANGTSLVLAEDLGPGGGRNCDTHLPSAGPARFGFGSAGRASRGLGPNQVLLISGHVSQIFWDTTGFL